MGTGGKDAEYSLNNTSISDIHKYLKALVWLITQNKYSSRSQTAIFSKTKPVLVFIGQKVSMKDCTGKKMYFERRDIHEGCKICPKRWKEAWKKTAIYWQREAWKKEMEWYLRV